MIKETIHKLKNELPSTVKLVAVSKFHPLDAIEEAYEAGQRCFAESRPQELAAKVKALESMRLELSDPEYMADVEWHFIGHLQTNKLKMVLPYVELVQSVDSIRLLDAIDRWGAANGKVINVLLECFISNDQTKQGLSEQELMDILSGEKTYANVCIRGLMGMATFTDDENVIRADFQRLLDLQQVLHDWVGENPNVHPGCNELSFGMSDDYKIAVSMGSTMVRVGSMIFGERY